MRGPAQSVACLNGRLTTQENLTYNQWVRRIRRDPFFFWLRDTTEMDKKTKKRLEVLRHKIEKTQKLLAAAREQTDEPDEILTLEKQLAEYHAETTELKNK